MSSTPKLSLIKDRIDIVDLVGQHITLRKKGNSYVGLCPFHADHNPSLSVSAKKKLFKCFSCGVGGDIFQFWSKIKNISFQESVQKLAEQAGVKIKSSNYNYKWTEAQQQIFDINNHFMRYCFNFLHTKNASAQNALKYLKTQRCLTRSIIAQFQIGFCPNQNQIIDFFTQDSKYTLSELVDSGLVLLDQKRKFCPFSNRILIPILGVANKVYGFSGRALEGTGAKYINSIETQTFQKHCLFFNWDSVVQQQNTYIIICEGGFDVMALTQAGIKNCIGLLGTNLTADHIKLLQSQKSWIGLWLDSDHPGQVATIKMAAKILAAGIEVKIYPSDVTDADPASVMKRLNFKINPEKLIKKWQHPVTFAINLFRPELKHKEVEAVHNFIIKINQLLRFETDPLIFNTFISRLSVLTELTEKVIRESIKPPIQYLIPTEKKLVNFTSPSLQKAQWYLLKLGWNRRSNFKIIDHQLTVLEQQLVEKTGQKKVISADLMVDCTPIWIALKNYYSSHQENAADLNPAEQKKILGDKNYNQMTAILKLEKDHPDRYENDSEIKDCVLRITRHHLTTIMVKMESAKKNASNKQKIALSQKIVELNQEIKNAGK